MYVLGLELGWSPPTRNVEVTKKQEDETFLELNRLTQKIESYDIKTARQRHEKAADRCARSQARMQQERREQV